MTQQQILTALKLQPTQLTKKYAGKLVTVLNLVNELNRLPGFNVILNGVKGNVEMVMALPELFEDNYISRSQFWEAQKQQDNCREIYGLFEQWDNITVSHENGCYNFPVPVGNDIYTLFAGMAGVDVNNKVADVTIKQTIQVDAGIIGTFGKAAKFVSKDSLRPHFECVLIHIKDNTAVTVATDCHTLYKSQKFGCNVPDEIKLLISEQDAKMLSKIKPDGNLVDFNILENDALMVHGNIIPLHDYNYPDYEVVIPSYENYMEFDKKHFVNTIKQVYPFANKATNMVTFHLNGSIAMKAEDVDFGFERSADMSYISKGFKDTDIAFNGKFLLETCSIFKDKTLKFYSEGKNTRAAIISNGNDSVLLMPLMIGGDY